MGLYYKFYNIILYLNEGTPKELYYKLFRV